MTMSGLQGTRTRGGGRGRPWSRTPGGRSTTRDGGPRRAASRPSAPGDEDPSSYPQVRITRRANGGSLPPSSPCPARSRDVGALVELRGEVLVPAELVLRTGPHLLQGAVE